MVIVNKSERILRVTYHIGIESGHVEARLTGQVLTMLQTVVQVTSLEVVRNSRSLGASHVVHVGLMLGKLSHSRLKLLRLTIIQYNDLEPIKRVVLGTSGTDGIHHNSILLTTARDEDINSWHIVAAKSQLRSATALGSPHCPDVVQHRWDGDGNLNGEENPCLNVRLASHILR